MKYILTLIVCTALLSFYYINDIYSVPVNGIDGVKIDLNQYRGKKLLFIVLPLSTQDTTVSINDITQLQTRHQSSLVVIGIPSEEAGFKTGDEGRLKKLYRDAAAGIVITEGMKVKKGTGQSALFQWLTSKDQNRHFNQDVRGVGSKFFVDESGELYAVTGPQLRLTHPLMDRILTRAQRKKQ